MTTHLMGTRAEWLAARIELLDVEKGTLAIHIVVAAAFSAERLAPAGERIARVIGAIAIGTGYL